jgi:hypothetical protein
MVARRQVFGSWLLRHGITGELKMVNGRALKSWMPDRIMELSQVPTRLSFPAARWNITTSRDGG